VLEGKDNMSEVLSSMLYLFTLGFVEVTGIKGELVMD